jgi:NAD(P)-dependent dehydrogenase (short-subunit alcohol dehydrogenase family)
MKAYEQSKLANVLFTVELAEQLKNSSISVACLHPGKVKTRLGRKALGSNFFSKLVITAMQWFTFLFGISANKAAKAVVMLALSHEVKNISGKYFSKGKILSPHTLVNDVYIRKKLWVVSEQYTKEYYNYNITRCAF